MSEYRSGGKVRSGYHDNARTDILHLIETPGRILDVGGGNGATSALIRQQFGADHVAVIDGADAQPLDEVDEFIQGDLNGREIWDTLAADQERFDTILCLDVLEHLIDPWTAVQRCADLLNDGGHLIVSLPNARNYRLTFPLFFLGEFPLKDSGILDRTHLRWFVRSSAISLVEGAGLKLVSCEGAWYMNRSKWWERLAKVGIAPGFLYQVYHLKAIKTS